MKTFKIRLLTIAMLLCSILASAHDFKVDGIYYNITSNTDLTVEVSFKGNDPYSLDNEYTGNVVVPESVSYNGSTYSVTSIGDNAFYNCSGLTSITIPNSETSIGYTAFFGCTGLTSITIPNSVTSIGLGVFAGCTNLTSIVVDPNNQYYDSRENCNAIIETSSNTLIAGTQKTEIPNSVTSIGDYAFYSCTGLTSITIPNSVTSIGYYAFSGCN